MKNCIWALLALDELKFVTIPCFEQPDSLLGHSLFEFIHPEEVTLAQRDLYKFISAKTLSGSVTRCRIQDFTTTYSTNWIVVDIIMYIATDSLVLVFIHKVTSSQTSSSFCCKDHNFSLVTLKNTIQQFPVQSPRQFFHILDNQSKSVQLSWPDHYPNEMEGAQMSFFDDRPMSPQRPVSCFRCIQRPICTTSLGQQLHSLAIEYGTITFLLVKITSNNPLRSVSSSPELFDRSKYGLSQQHQHHPNPSLDYDDNMYYTSYRRKRCVSYEGVTKQDCHNNPSGYSFGTNTSPRLHPIMHRKRCQSCGTHTSPEWRRGPTGHKTLCNACGLRYSRSISRQGKLALQKRHSSFQSQSTTTTTMTPRTPPSPQSSLSSSTSSSSQSFHMNLTDPIPFMPNYPKHRSF